MRQVVGLWVLNAIDAVSTRAALIQGWTEELNPIMARLYDSVGVDAGTGAKMILMTLAVGWWAENWDRPTVRKAVSGLAWAYSVTVLWHAAAWSAVGVQPTV